MKEKTTIKDGGPAFPYSVQRLQSGYHQEVKGMSLRDWFAGQATEQDIEMHTGGEIHPKSGGIINGRTREQAKYAYADAMLAAREVKP